jgi:hypothetical protein
VSAIWTRPEPWTCRKNASIGLSTQISSDPASAPDWASSARAGYGTTLLPASLPRRRMFFSSG